MGFIKTIEIDGRPVEFKASAAIPRMYRNMFGRDIFQDISHLAKTVEGQDENVSGLDGYSLGMFEDLSYVMYMAAHPGEKYNSPDEWLDQFQTLSIYKILPELMQLWETNMETTVSAEKNGENQSGN